MKENAKNSQLGCLKLNLNEGRKEITIVKSTTFLKSKIFLEDCRLQFETASTRGLVNLSKILYGFGFRGFGF